VFRFEVGKNNLSLKNGRTTLIQKEKKNEEKFMKKRKGAKENERTVPSPFKYDTGQRKWQERGRGGRQFLQSTNVDQNGLSQL
jgi:hypothetical protein